MDDLIVLVLKAAQVLAVTGVGLLLFGVVLMLFGVALLYFTH